MNNCGVGVAGVHCAAGFNVRKAHICCAAVDPRLHGDDEGRNYMS